MSLEYETGELTEKQEQEETTEAIAEEKADAVESLEQNENEPVVEDLNEVGEVISDDGEVDEELFEEGDTMIPKDSSSESESEEVPESDGDEDAGEEEGNEPESDAPEKEHKNSKAFDDSFMDMLAVGFFSLAFGILLCCLGTLVPTGGSSSGAIAATVNGEPIYESAITEMITESYNAINSDDSEEHVSWGEWLGGIGYESGDELRKAAIDSIVSEKLLAQAAEEQGITVTDEEIEAEHQESLEQYGGEETLKEMVEMYGMTMDDYMDNIRTSLIQQKLMEKVVDKGEVSEASDDEVKQILESYYGMKEGDEDYDEAFASIKEQMEQQALYTKFSEWMDAFKERSEITYSEMPAGMPYDVTPVKTVSNSNSISLEDLMDQSAEEAGESQGEAVAEE